MRSLSRRVWLLSAFLAIVLVLPGELRADLLGDVRGRGAMLAIEIVKPGTNEPDPVLTKAIAAEAFKRGVILLTCGSYGNIIRLLPPLVISDELLDEGIAVLADIVREMAAAR